MITSCVDALAVFEQAPAKHSLKDRKVVFPGYCFFSTLIKCGFPDAPSDQNPTEFKNAIAAKFVRETQFQLFQHCRALSIKVEHLLRSNNFQGAFTVVNETKSMYDPKLHYAALAKTMAWIIAQ